MRSARERVGLVDALSAVQGDFSTGWGNLRSTSKRTAKRLGVLGACTAAAALGVRLLGAAFSRSRRAADSAPAPGGLRLALTKQIITLLLLPLAKEYLVRRTLRAALKEPSPSPAPARAPRPEAEPATRTVEEPRPLALLENTGDGVRLKIRELPFLARFSPRRAIARWLGL